MSERWSAAGSSRSSSGLERKGRLEFGRMADVVVMDADTLEIVHVISRGRWMVRDGKELARERFLEESNRRIELVGEKD